MSLLPYQVEMKEFADRVASDPNVRVMFAIRGSGKRQLRPDTLQATREAAKQHVLDALDKQMFDILAGDDMSVHDLPIAPADLREELRRMREDMEFLKSQVHALQAQLHALYSQRAGLTSVPYRFDIPTTWGQGTDGTAFVLTPTEGVGVPLSSVSFSEPHR